MDAKDEAPKPVSVRQVLLDGPRIVLVDSEGRLWERLGDMKIGQWGEIPLPVAPAKDTTKRTTRKGVR